MSLLSACATGLLLLAAFGVLGCASTAVEPGDWQTIVDSNWTLKKMNGRAPLSTQNRNTGVKPPTLDLTDDGRVIGFAGVNRFFGTYEATDDGRIRFAALGSTRMFRDNPPGLMEQETRYFQTLGEIDGYRIRRGQLVLLTERKVRLVFDPPILPEADEDAPDDDATDG